MHARFALAGSVYVFQQNINRKKLILASQSPVQSRPIEALARIIFSSGCNVFMACNVPNGKLQQEGRAQPGQRCILSIFKKTSFKSFEFDPNGVIVAIISPTITGSTGMPCTVIAADKLQQFTRAADKKMGRYSDVPNALKIGVLVPGELVGKQALNMLPAILAWRQADRMQYQQINLCTIRARAIIWRRELIC